MSEETKKLYLPKFCVVPLQAREDETLSDAAKIYLGEINVLTNKFGYLGYPDKMLAEMKGVSERTILNYHKDLEVRGFISRKSWKEHYKNPDGPGVLIRSKRKLYVIENPKKMEEENNEYEEDLKYSPDMKEAAPQDLKYSPDMKVVSPRSDMKVVSPRSDMKEVAGINELPLNKELENNNEFVVVPSCLKNLEISPSLQVKLTKLYISDPKRIKDACASIAQIKPRNLEAALQTALKEGWKPKVSKEDIEGANKQWTETNLRKYDNTQVGPFRCDIIPGGLQFSGVNSNTPRYFSYEDISFKEEVTKLMNKLLKS